MKLITFDDRRVGRLELEERLVLPLEVGSTREYFERAGQVSETGDRLRLDDVQMRAPIVPKKFFHTSGNFREHEDESKKSTGRTPCTRASCSSRTSTRSSARTSR
jgi:hypothetical protein